MTSILNRSKHDIFNKAIQLFFDLFSFFICWMKCVNSISSGRKWYCKTGPLYSKFRNKKNKRRTKNENQLGKVFYGKKMWKNDFFPSFYFYFEIFQCYMKQSERFVLFIIALCCFVRCGEDCLAEYVLHLSFQVVSNSKHFNLVFGSIFLVALCFQYSFCSSLLLISFYIIFFVCFLLWFWSLVRVWKTAFENTPNNP